MDDRLMTPTTVAKMVQRAQSIVDSARRMHVCTCAHSGKCCAAERLAQHVTDMVRFQNAASGRQSATLSGIVIELDCRESAGSVMTMSDGPMERLVSGEATPDDLHNAVRDTAEHELARLAAVRDVVKKLRRAAGIVYTRDDTTAADDRVAMSLVALADFMSAYGDPSDILSKADILNGGVAT